ncbi:PA2779 family protein [Azotobacter salinestris]|uniref:PA2779 family protein n=1 Tax=Azotobacter salinestris TaxID=69964 RepID=UPI0032DEBAF2
MSTSTPIRRVAGTLAALQLLMCTQIPMAQAAMIGTPEVIAAEQHQVDRQQLLQMLEDREVRQKLEALGVDRQQVEQRIGSLTSAELAEFNRQLAEAPAGGNVLGIIVLFLVIFIITDMLCATDVYTFVRCINR